MVNTVSKHQGGYPQEGKTRWLSLSMQRLKDFSFLTFSKTIFSEKGGMLSKVSVHQKRM